MVTGQCVCGEVTIDIDGPRPTEMIVCHCVYCQLAAGSAFCASVLVKKVDLTISGPVKQHKVTAASGNPVVHFSCASCNNTIAHTAALFPDSIAVHVTYVRELTTLPVVKELFVRTRWPSLKPIEGVAQFEMMP